MAGRDEVMATLRAQNARFAHPKVASSFKDWSRVMQYVFPDIGLAATITVKDGVPGEPVEGRAEDAPVRYEMFSDTFLAIARKELSGMKACTQKLDNL